MVTLNYILYNDIKSDESINNSCDQLDIHKFGGLLIKL